MKIIYTFKNIDTVLNFLREIKTAKDPSKIALDARYTGAIEYIPGTTSYHNIRKDKGYVDSAGKQNPFNISIELNDDKNNIKEMKTGGIKIDGTEGISFKGISGIYNSFLKNKDDPIPFEGGENPTVEDAIKFFRKIKTDMFIDLATEYSEKSYHNRNVFKSAINELLKDILTKPLENLIEQFKQIYKKLSSTSDETKNSTKHRQKWINKSQPTGIQSDKNVVEENQDQKLEM